MEEILKMLFGEILIKREEIKKIGTVEDLCKVTWNKDKLVSIFAANNGDRGGFDTDEIIAIANKAYQEVCANE